MRAVLAILVIVWLAGQFAPRTAAPERQQVSFRADLPRDTAPTAATVGNGIGELVIPRSPDGHFYLDAQVGSATVHFLVDTGASVVALTRADAQAAGLQFAPGDFTATGMGAGGKIALKPVVLPSVSAGALSATNVEAVVLAGDGTASLLGQSWLRRVGTVTIEGDVLRLR